jgi:hypothetical protein
MRLEGFFFHWLCSLPGPGSLIFSFMNILQTVGLLGRVMSSSQSLYLNIGQHKDTINKCTYQISMRFVGFEPTLPASEQAKTVHTVDRSATVTGWLEGLGKLKYLVTSSGIEPTAYRVLAEFVNQLLCRVPLR